MAAFERMLESRMVRQPQRSQTTPQAVETRLQLSQATFQPGLLTTRNLGSKTENFLALNGLPQGAASLEPHDRLPVLLTGRPEWAPV
jgi:hypothetical protein